MGFDKLSMNYSSNCQTRGWEPGGSSNVSEACVWIWGHESGKYYSVGRLSLKDHLCQGSPSVLSALGLWVTGLQVLSGLPELPGPCSQTMHMDLADITAKEQKNISNEQ